MPLPHDPNVQPPRGFLVGSGEVRVVSTESRRGKHRHGSCIQALRLVLCAADGGGCCDDLWTVIFAAQEAVDCCFVNARDGAERARDEVEFILDYQAGWKSGSSEEGARAIIPCEASKLVDRPD